MSLLTIALIIALAAIVALIFALAREIDEKRKLRRLVINLERQIQLRTDIRMTFDGEMAVVK